MPLRLAQQVRGAGREALPPGARWRATGETNPATPQIRTFPPLINALTCANRLRGAAV